MRRRGWSFVFDSLMVSALDEPDAVYGLLAKERDHVGGSQRLRFSRCGRKRGSMTARR